MYVEKLKDGKNTKFFLSHTIRIGNKTRKIRRYLGLNLTKTEIDKLLPVAKKHLSAQIQELQQFTTSIAPQEVEQLNKIQAKAHVTHLQKPNWKNFVKQFTYNTNAIEGSTVKASEVSGILENEQIPNSSDEQETVNVANALDFVRNTSEKLSLSLILKLHKLCFSKTKPFAGQFRTVPVVIRNAAGQVIHEGAPVNEIKSLLSTLIKWYYENKYPPLYVAAVLHNEFEKIHPFQDGNGRVGRLLLNYALLNSKFPPVNILLSDRKRYYDCLRAYDLSGDSRPMMRLIVASYKKQLKK